jgi:hypothetical protein
MGLIDDIAAGAYSAFNSALFGLPETVVKAIGDDAADKRLEKWKTENESAMSTGDLVGTVGSMLIPGGLITKGLGKGLSLLGRGAEALKLGKLAKGIATGAKALDIGGDIIRGTRTIGEGGGKLAKVGGMALRGALGAAETSLPRAIISGDYSGLGRDALLGSVMAPLTGALASRASKAASRIGRKVPGKVAVPARRLGLNSDDILDNAGEIPEGWFLHGRNPGKKFGASEYPTQLTRSANVAKSYGSKGEIWAAKPKESAKVANFFSPTSKDMRKFLQNIKEAHAEATGEGLLSPIQDVLDEIATAKGISPDDLDIDEALAEIGKAFSPSDIVNSAEAYDNPAFTSLLEYFGSPRGQAWPDWIHTPDGAVMLPGSEGIETYRLR